MGKFFPIASLGIFLFTAPLQAADNATSGRDAAGAGPQAQERFKDALNEVALKVRAAPAPAEKRAIMLRFAAGVESGLRDAQGYAVLSDADKLGLQSLQETFHAYAAELDGRDGLVRVPDADLDDYAGYMLQRMEQAPVGGGVYISGGALLLIILILILVL
jgi:hypothetical protein